MKLTSSFLDSYRTERRPTARLEYVLAVARTFLAVTGFIAIYLDPTEPTRLATIAYGVLVGYACYSVVVLVLVRRVSALQPAHGYFLHALDILWAALLTFVSDGPISPFYLFFLFVTLASAYRWGMRATIATAVGTALLYIAQTAAAYAGPWPALLIGDDFDVKRIIFRIGYLLITGYVAGFLAEQEKGFRAEMAAAADAMQQARVELGLGGSVVSLGRMLIRIFAATSADIVIHERNTERALLWHVVGAAGVDESTGNDGAEIAPENERRWLFEQPVRTWYVARPDPGEPVRARAVQPGAWSLRSVAIRLPAGFPPQPCRSLIVTDVGLGDEWRGRIVLYDAPPASATERCLHFLDSLTGYVTPALTNVVLLRRLHSQASAAERARVARELHDGTIQALFGIEMKLQALRRRTTGDHELAAGLEDVQELLRGQILGVRELMQALRPVELDAVHPLTDVIASVVERFRRDSGISARFVSNVTTTTLTPAASIEVVRIVQEALANTRKHSRARNVLVRLTRAGDEYILSVEDDGRGFDFTGTWSHEQLDRERRGPAIIKERARLIGGSVTVESTPGAGSRIRVTFGAPVHA
jgi:signal transduction histidine kinase